MPTIQTHPAESYTLVQWIFIRWFFNDKCVEMYEFYRQCKHEFMSLYKLSTIKDIAIMHNMVIWVVKFPREGYKKDYGFFCKKSEYLLIFVIKNSK